MKTGLFKKSISIFLTVLMVASGIIPTLTAFAGDGVEGYYDLQIFYKSNETMVPSYADDGESEYIEYMVEGDELELEYKLIDSVFPDNGYVKWYSENPVLVDVTSEGVVKAFDSSKGAVVQSWIDNEVKTIPLIGSVLGTLLEKALFNDYVDLDTMDAEEIVEIVTAVFGSDSIIAGSIEAYEGQLIDSLREYLDKVNTGIHCVLYDGDDNQVAEDIIKITVTKCEEWYANFLPNGTHIVNKAQINTTQAVGNTVQLYAMTTPQRLGYGTVYSVKSSSIFSTGKVVATVTDDGLVTFKNTGTVTILTSPDSEDVIEGILALVNKLYELDNTGTLDTDKVAEIMIKYMGIDMNREVLRALLDAALAVYQVVEDTADPVQLTATAVEIIANIILQMKYNDSITFTVINAQPLTDFDIEGASSVKEGAQIQLSITNVEPDAGDTSDITWTSSDPTIACVDEKTGVITGLDAGGSLGNLSSQTCTIYATSAANGVTRSVNITVTGKTGKYISAVDINGLEQVEINGETDYTYTVYPKRVAEADNLYISWGMQTDTDDEGNPVYSWADSENTVSDGIGQISYTGHYTAVGGGKSVIAVKAVTGYYLSNGDFYEISSHTSTKEISTGIPVEQIKIIATDGTSNGDLNRDEIITINGVDYEYITIHKGLMEGYAGNGAKFEATVYPENATVQDLTWVVDNSYYNIKDLSDDTHSLSVVQKAGHEVADTFNIYAISNDGRIKSNVITVCVTRNYVTGNTITTNNIEVIRGQTVDVEHEVSFDTSWTSTAYACYKANWYSSDESIFSVVTQRNDNRDGTVTGVDVGYADLYCVSADGGIIGTATVCVKPDKTHLQEIVNICDNASVERTANNKKLYQQYMKKLDLAYAVLYDQDMASQTTCDTYADELLQAFYAVGGFVGINSVTICGTNNKTLENKFISVKVGSLTSYTKYKYDLDYTINPKGAMYSKVEWTSSDDSISVNSNGVCTPTSNDPCSAIITCTVTDYMGSTASDSVIVAFARTQATGIELDTTEITGGKVGETVTLEATVLPTNVFGSSSASCEDVAWKSTDTSVATVDMKGNVTFVYGGDCQIICTTMDGGYTAVCNVNVVTNYDPLQLLLTQYSDLGLNESSFYPDTWAEYTAAVNKAQNMINQGGYSQKEVDAMCTELENAYKSLKKYNYIQRVELYLDGEQTAEFYQYDLSLLKEGISYKNATLDLNVRLYPNNASYNYVVWESSTTDISVTTEGVCSPTVNTSCYGRITCTVYDHFGNSFTDSVWVSFSYYPVTALVLSDSNINGNVGDTYQLACTVEPTGSSYFHIGAASIQDYYWESDDKTVATVDQDGVVTFISAGSTIIRAVSYDGGIYAECKASTEGDRSALKEALEKYADIDVTNYDYDCGVAFQNAYQQAENALVDLSLKQNQIDEVANNLVNAAEQMLSNPYIAPESFSVSYTSYKRSLVNKSTKVASGTIGSNNALSINLSSDYSNYNNYNDLKLNAEVYPSNAMYKSISWTVDESTTMDTDIDGTTITLTPSKKSDGGYAKLTIKTVDHFDRTCSRTIYIVMADKIAGGIWFYDESLTLPASSTGQQLTYYTSGSSEFPTLLWSSSNEAVAKVDESGYLTPIDKGEAVITVYTVDGGYTATMNISVYTDFSQLAEKVSTYSNLIDNSTGQHKYTEESLTALSVVVAQAKTMVDEGKATQAEVDKMLIEIETAYFALVEYKAADGVVLGFEENSNVTSPNANYIRFTNTTLTNKQIQLTASITPDESAVYKSLTWESSNDKVTVDNFGLVTNTTSTAKYSVITCTVVDEFENSYSSSVTVSFVRYGANEVTFDEDMIYGAPQEVKQIKPNLNQSSTTISSSIVNDCTYKSSDESIATVDNDGNVTFVSQGTAIITVTSCDGGYVGTIEAYTTWDTTALQASIALGENITYTDYAYAQGIAFKSAFEKAQEVYSNIYATQDEIDMACFNLETAITNLEGNEFIAPEVEITTNGKAIENNRTYEVDNNKQFILEATLNEGAMVKSTQFTISDENGVVISSQDSTKLVLTKTDTTATLIVTFTVVDDYDRETDYSYEIKLTDAIVNIDSFNFTVDGEETTNSTYSETGLSSYTNFDGIQLGIKAYPENATEPASISWSSSASSYVKVDSNGLVTLTTAGKIKSTNVAVITCVVTNADGSTVEKSITITIAR